MNVDSGQRFVYATVDCTDLRILEPTPFDAAWYSHKTNCSALRYEVAVSLSGNIVWVNGPFKAGEFADLRIFRNRLRYCLLYSECVIADGTYRDTKCIYNDGCEKEIIQRSRARQESVFRRLKSFNVLSSVYRHDIRKHSNCLFAVANLVQYSIENGEPLFN